MTERKTTEIKIRVTPSFKARVQGAADAAGVSLTEWLESASEERMVALLVPDSSFFNEALGVLPHWSPETHPVVFKGAWESATPVNAPLTPKSWMYEGQGG